MKNKANLLGLIVLISIFVPIFVHASGDAQKGKKCDGILSNDQSAGYKPNQEILNALADFPNEEIRQKDTYDFKNKVVVEVRINSKNNTEDLWKEMAAKLSKATSEVNADVVPYNYLPTTILQKDTKLEAEYSPDFNALVGLAIVGSHNTSSSTDYERQVRDRTTRFFSGIVKAVHYESDPSGQREHLRLALRKANGEIVDELINVSSFWLGEKRVLRSIGYGEDLFLVLPKATPEDRLKLAWQNSNLIDLVERSFGSPSTPKDFAVARAAIETALSVPATYGPTAVIKILLGRQMRNGESFPNFGLVKGERRYNEAALRRFLAPLNEFMILTGVIGPDQAETFTGNESSALPEYLTYRQRTKLAPAFLKMWDQMTQNRGRDSN